MMLDDTGLLAGILLYKFMRCCLRSLECIREDEACSLFQNHMCVNNNAIAE